jgi:electron transfer flavoprotein alpha subunit
VSGQIQHTVGVSVAKLIAAVNKDQEAPIFTRHPGRPGD